MIKPSESKKTVDEIPFDPKSEKGLSDGEKRIRAKERDMEAKLRARERELDEKFSKKVAELEA